MYSRSLSDESMLASYPEPLNDQYGHYEHQSESSLERHLSLSELSDEMGQLAIRVPIPNGKLSFIAFFCSTWAL